jgi:hypothetical protein
MSRWTSRWTTLAVTLTVATALLALAACGGDDSTSSATATADSHATATHKTDQNATKTEAPTDTPSDTGDIASQLAALGGDIQQVTGKVTYANTDTSGTTTTITFYSKPPNSRFDTVDSDGAISSYIQTSDTTYICSSDAAKTDQSCVEETGTTGGTGLGLAGSFFSPVLVDALAAAAQAQGVDINKSSENIAGTDADCYEGTYSGSTEKFCFSGDGVMLAELTTDASGTSGLTATAYSSDVSDSDFQPLYPISTIIPGQ